MPTTSSKTITDLPTELIDQIIISLGSEVRFMLSSPQMIKNIRRSSRFFDSKQDGFYKALIKRYYPSIQWAMIEGEYNEHLLPFSAIYGLLYRKIHDSYLVSLK